MASGNGPILKDGATLEFSALGLPPDPLKVELTATPATATTASSVPSHSVNLDNLDTPGDAHTSVLRSQNIRNTPHLRPLRFNDADVVSRLERRMHVAKRARAIAAIGNRSDRRSRTKYGLLKNPFYPYEGGPLTRLMTFLANMLKLLEQLLLGRLKKVPAVTLRKKPVPKKKEVGPNSLFTEEEKQKKLKQQQQRRAPLKI